MVVQITLGGQYLEFFIQYRRHKFLGGGFSVGTGYGQNPRGHLPAMETSQILKGFQGIGHIKKSVSSFQVGTLGNHKRRAFGAGVFGKVVGVEIFAFQGKKYTIFDIFARIGGNARMLAEMPVEFLNIFLGIHDYRFK